MKLLKPTWVNHNGEGRPGSRCRGPAGQQVPRAGRAGAAGERAGGTRGGRGAGGASRRCRALAGRPRVPELRRPGSGRCGRGQRQQQVRAADGSGARALEPGGFLRAAWGQLVPGRGLGPPGTECALGTAGHRRARA